MTIERDADRAAAAGTGGVAVFLIVLLALSGCDDGSPTRTEPLEPQIVDGFWEGRVFDIEFEMILREDESGAITGEGAIIRPTDSQAFRVSGSNSFPDVALLFEFGGHRTGEILVFFRGEFTSTHVFRGRLNGGGFNDDRVVFRRDLHP